VEHGSDLCPLCAEVDAILQIITDGKATRPSAACPCIGFLGNVRSQWSAVQCDNSFHITEA
jgi:hypothetical protein